MTSSDSSAAPALEWVDRWLSGPRFAVYLAAAGGVDEDALELYEWNADLSAAFLHDLGHLEVGLRNAYNSALEQHGSFSNHWTLSSAQVFAPVYRTKRRWSASAGRRVPIRVDVNEKSRKTLEQAVREAGGPSAPPGKIVAQLMFGFWRYLSDSTHEVPLWRPYLHHAFPAGTARGDVDDRADKLHRLRNRVAHHEPLLGEDLDARFKALVELADLIEPDLGDHIRRHSRVPPLIASRPGGPTSPTSATGR